MLKHWERILGQVMSHQWRSQGMAECGSRHTILNNKILN